MSNANGNGNSNGKTNGNNSNVITAKPVTTPATTNTAAGVNNGQNNGQGHGNADGQGNGSQGNGNAFGHDHDKHDPVTPVVVTPVTAVQKCVDTVWGYHATGDAKGTALDFSNGIAATLPSLVDKTGTDTIDFSLATAATQINLMLYGQCKIGTSQFNLGSSVIENAIGGSGNDLIVGNSGNNVITGGAGNDAMSGGRGADTFVFAAGAGKDGITDFNAKEGDKLDLSQITHGDLHLAAGTAFHGIAAEVIYNQGTGYTKVQIDVDGDRVADIQILLTGVAAAQFGAGCILA